MKPAPASIAARKKELARDIREARAMQDFYYSIGIKSGEEDYHRIERDLIGRLSEIAKATREL